MKFLLRILIIISFQPIVNVSAGNKTDTTWVISHNQVQVVTNPKLGVKSYFNWAQFPSNAVEYRRVWLDVQFACPDSMRCADWDYLDHIRIGRIGSSNSNDTLKIELARMLTPYGGAFPKDWNFNWRVDVTDFASLLHDSVEIEYLHSGYESCTDRGWKISVKFICVQGPAPARLLQRIPAYNGSFAYGDSSDNIENHLIPIHFTTPSDNSYVRFRISQTGHGMNPADDCGEFCSRNRSVWLDNLCIDTRSIWKLCGDNPLFPQAGTWIYNRANWCPGELHIPTVYDGILPSKGNHILNVDMQPYQLSGSTARESISSYLFVYEKPRLALDVCLEEIIAPSDEKRYGRMNPIAQYPVIRVRNLGYEKITSLQIRYTIGATNATFIWHGLMSFNQSEQIILPGVLPVNQTKFSAVITKVNGKSDQYTLDNSLTSVFTPVPCLDDTIIFRFQTNKEASQNALLLTSELGDTLLFHAAGSLKNQQLYYDTLSLKNKAYTLLLTDSAGDGLEFWFNTSGGRGTFKILNARGEMIRDFESDFGNKIVFSFRHELNAHAPILSKPAVGVFPTRTTGPTMLDYYATDESPVRIVITGDDGKTIVEEHVYQSLKLGLIPFDFSYRKPQRYYIKVYVRDELIFNKRIRVVDSL